MANSFFSLGHAENLYAVLKGRARMLSFRSFEIVAAISRDGSLRRAAEALKMTQPALTKALSSLESEISAKLFERNPTGMQPTPFAHIIVQRWESLYQDLLEMRREIDSMRGLTEGRRRIATGLLATSSVEIALGRLVQNFPSIQISSQQLSWSEIANSVRRADVDIGVADPEAAKDDPLLDVEILKEQKAFFVCRKDHPLLNLISPKLEDILAYPMALNLVPSCWAMYFPDDMSSFGFHRLESGHLLPPIQIHSISALKNILINSNAISILPIDIMPDVFSARNLMRIENFSAPWLKVRVGYITRKHAVRTSAMDVFINEVRRIELDLERADVPDQEGELVG